MPFYLLDREPIVTGLRRIAHEQIAIALRDLADGELPVHRRVHSLRSRCKKMRGLLRLPGPLMGEAFGIEDRRFHAAAKAVAASRDQAVCAKTITCLRKWTKYHWYQIRILERLDKPALRKRRRRFRSLQLVLGDAHDLVLLQARLAAEDDRNTRLLQRAIARKEALYGQAIKTGRTVFEASADELVADLAGYWADSRGD